jgi:hypothetical protein
VVAKPALRSKRPPSTTEAGRHAGVVVKPPQANLAGEEAAMVVKRAQS